MKAPTIALAALLALSACTQSQVPAGQFNEAASLPPSFGFSKLGLRVLATFVNRRQATTATLYGNDLARRAALGSPGEGQPGAVLALLTWQQQADPNWFGARIMGAYRLPAGAKARPAPLAEPLHKPDCAGGSVVAPPYPTASKRAALAARRAGYCGRC